LNSEKLKIAVLGGTGNIGEGIGAKTSSSKPNA